MTSDGLVRVDHHDEKGGHHYLSPEGQRILSVSDVLSIGGITDYSGIPPEVLQRAANRGIMVHLACEDLDRGRPDWWSDDQEIAPRVQAYEAWKKDSGFKVTHSEHLVWNQYWGYAGTVDRIGTIDDDVVVIDLKATSKIYPWTALQVAAYAMACEASRRMAVWLKPDGKFKQIEYSGGNDMAVFLGALAVAKWKVQNGLWKTA